jgi:hypothetical protein
MNGRIKLLESFSINLWQYDLYGALEDDKDYDSLFSLLDEVSETDCVIIRLSCPGGSVTVGEHIIDAIKGCRGHCKALVFSTSASMASFIALACDSLEFAPNTDLMFHAPSSGMEGFMSHMHNYTGIHGAQLKLKTIDWMCPFFSKKEVENMWDGHEIYITDKDPSLAKRIERHFKNRKK